MAALYPGCHSHELPDWPPYLPCYDGMYLIKSWPNINSSSLKSAQLFGHSDKKVRWVPRLAMNWSWSKPLRSMQLDHTPVYLITTEILQGQKKKKKRKVNPFDSRNLKHLSTCCNVLALLYLHLNFKIYRVIKEIRILGRWYYRNISCITTALGYK